jgi:phosphoglycolate phosphatase-like HAD superfamily hydrolase
LEPNSERHGCNGQTNPYSLAVISETGNHRFRRHRRFVGDRPFDDIHGAKSLGMRAVLLPNDVVPPYADAEPDAVISRLSDLPPLIESWT